MDKRFVSIWFRHLLTDWMIRQKPDLKDQPLVLTVTDHGKKIITAMTAAAESGGIFCGMSLADARALEPGLKDFDEKEGLNGQILDLIADWCIRYTPAVSVDLPDGILLDVTGCAHLYDGEHQYLKDIVVRLRDFGYDARAAMADTPGMAWATARYGKTRPIILSGESKSALAIMPPAALRLDPATLDRLRKLGIRKVSDLMNIPSATLNRRFGKGIALRLNQALGHTQENIIYKRHVDPYIENLMTAQGVATAEGIAAGLENLLTRLCSRLERDGKGVRFLTFEGFRVDGIIERVEIGTNRPSRNTRHLFRLFQEKLPTIEPALGIEQFRLSAREIDDITPAQSGMLDDADGLDDEQVKELIDRVATRHGIGKINRYLPKERHWPERSVKATKSMLDQKQCDWSPKLRPISLLPRPEPIEVVAPVPDHPPRLFRHKGNLHHIRKADGPERIEREWWIEDGDPRDYFRVEDEEGRRYWVFRSGHYNPQTPAAWFLHGFFA